mgnify:CR=1 FL=1
MKLHRIYGIILRHFFNSIHNYDRIGDMFYWPAIDLILWGTTSVYFASKINTPLVVLSIISGVIFWMIIWRGQYEITVGLLEDIWAQNLVNIFVSPVLFIEWIVAVLTIGILKMSIAVTFASLLSFWLFKINIFFFGFYLIIFALSLLMTGWAVGFLVAGLIIRNGTKIQTLAWTAIALLSPFSATSYPVSILPLWAQNIARAVPTSYIFENMRRLIFQHQINYSEIFISFGLNSIYLLLALIFLQRSFKKAKQKGFINLY